MLPFDKEVNWTGPGCQEPCKVPLAEVVQPGIGPLLYKQAGPHEVVRGLVISNEAFWMAMLSAKAGEVVQTRTRMDRKRKRAANFKGFSCAQQW